MENTRIAILDCGTNSFNLLLAEALEDKQFRIISNESVFVFMFQEEVEQISVQAQSRIFAALNTFQKQILDFNPKVFKGIATAGFRQAKNGDDILAEIKQKIGVDIECVSGEREAELIAKSIILSYGSKEPMRFWVMDIGGGSVEYILVNRRKIEFAISLPIGVAVLSPRYFEHANLYMEAKAEIIKHLQILHEPSQSWALPLIGAAGAFEVFEKACVSKQPTNDYNTKVSLPEFLFLCSDLTHAKKETLKKRSYIPPERADHIQAAALLSEQSLAILKPSEVLISKFSLKEGCLFEIIF